MNTVHNQKAANKKEFEKNANALNQAFELAKPRTQMNVSQNHMKPTNDNAPANNNSQHNTVENEVNSTTATQFTQLTQAAQNPQRQTHAIEETTQNNSQQQGQSQSASYTFDANTDYNKLIKDAVTSGNYQQAAIYEQQRNAKIAAQGLNYEQTNIYAEYLPGGAKFGTVYTSENDMSPLINQMYDQNAQQLKNELNHEIQGSVDQLNRALEDAQPSYRAAIANQLLETKQAQDAQALRNQVNGDRGGIGSAQVSSIGNTGAKNREMIAQQQRQLATDTARQIADLRAQGKYQEANMVLQNSQQRLAALYEEQVRVQQQQASQKEMLASIGAQFLENGQVPPEHVLAAMGLDRETAILYANMINGSGTTSSDYFEKLSADQLSGSAKAIANSLARTDVNKNQNSNLEIIMKAYDEGGISGAEAAYLLWMVDIGDGGYNDFKKTLEVWSKNKPGDSTSSDDFSGIL